MKYRCKKGKCSKCGKCNYCQCLCNGEIVRKSGKKGRPTTFNIDEHSNTDSPNKIIKRKEYLPKAATKSATGDPGPPTSKQSTNTRRSNRITARTQQDTQLNNRENTTGIMPRINLSQYTTPDLADRVISDKVTQASMSGMKKLSMSVAADFNTESYSIYSNSPLRHHLAIQGE